jgi:hypothetical protein
MFHTERRHTYYRGRLTMCRRGEAAKKRRLLGPRRLGEIGDALFSTALREFISLAREFAEDTSAPSRASG